MPSTSTGWSCRVGAGCTKHFGTGIERGELRPDLDIEIATIALIGPVLLQMHTGGRREPRPDLPEQLLDMLWPGLTAVSGPDQPAASSRIPAASERS